MNKDMRREFANSEELVAYLQAQFPTATARDSHTTNIIGGRKAAQELLEQVNPSKYASSRNFLTGAVTRLSPYIRYEVLSLAEIRSSVSAPGYGLRIHAQVQQKEQASKLNQRTRMARLLATALRPAWRWDLAR